MDYLEEPIVYLQKSDFDEAGNLVNPKIPKNKPVVIMLMANFCGYCTKAKPAYQEFALKHLGKKFNNFSGDFVVAAIQADGDQKGEKELNSILKKIDPSFQGFPSYVVYKNGKMVKNDIKGRDVKSLEDFVGV